MQTELFATMNLQGRTILTPVCRTSDPATSRAAGSIPRNGDRAEALREHAKARCYGLTDFELGDRMQRQQTSAGKRRLELQRMGLIEATDETRAAPSGSQSTVWRITHAGLDAARNL
jgi:hypothetical protein